MLKFFAGFLVLVVAAGLHPLMEGMNQHKALVPDLANTVAGKKWKIVNRRVNTLTDGTRTGVRFDEGPGEGLAFLPGVTLANGVIEFDVRGKNVPQKSFVGIAFHGVDEEAYDAIYFRPFNFRSDDSLRHIHAVQYISPPTHGWKDLREDHPGKYEKAIKPAPDPDDWFHARVVLSYPRVSVYVNGASSPCLVVRQLSDRKAGWVGFWVGDSSDGEFANLKITSGK